MSDDRPPFDPIGDLLSDTLRTRAADYLLPADGLDQIHLAVARRHRRQRTTWLVAAAALLVLVGIAAWSFRPDDDTSSPFVGPSEMTSRTAPESVPSAELVDPACALPGEVESSEPGGTERVAVDGNVGASSLDALARAVWPTVASDLELLGTSESTRSCTITVESPTGDVEVSGYQTADGLWYLGWVSSVESDGGESGEWGLSVQWLSDGTLDVYSSRTCPGCVTSEVTAFASGGTWVEPSGVPLEAHIAAPGSDGNRALLIRWFDAAGVVQRIHLTPMPDGDVAAG